MLIGVPSIKREEQIYAEAFVAFGGSNLPTSLGADRFNGIDGFHLTSRADLFFAPNYPTVAAAEDVNGDGLNDFLVGVPGAQEGGGSVYVVFGRRSGFGSKVDLEVLDGTNGYRIDGASSSEGIGGSLAGGGDVNGDGYDDFVLGTSGPFFISVPATYVIFGKPEGFKPVLSLANLTDTEGFRTDLLSARHHFDLALSAGGDLNGDGLGDWIIGNDSFENAEVVHLIYGGDFSLAINQMGSEGLDTLAGSPEQESLVGGKGNDVLDGQGGADVLYGGAGDDVLQVSDLGFLRVDGGNGTDRLVISGGGMTLNPVALGSRLGNIEIGDLGDADTGNILELSKVGLLGLSNNSNTVKVDGDMADRVDLIGGGWVRANPGSNGDQTFENGSGRLHVAPSVPVSLLP